MTSIKGFLKIENQNIIHQLYVDANSEVHTNKQIFGDTFLKNVESTM